MAGHFNWHSHCPSFCRRQHGRQIGASLHSMAATTRQPSHTFLRRITRRDLSPRSLRNHILHTGTCTQKKEHCILQRANFYFWVIQTLQEDKQTGTDLERFLNALSPVGAPTPAATPTWRSSGRRRMAGARESALSPPVAPGTGPAVSAVVPQPTHEGTPAPTLLLTLPYVCLQWFGMMLLGKGLMVCCRQDWGYFPCGMLLL